MWETQALMGYLAHTAILLWIAASGTFALSQTNACANPNAPRVGLFTMHNQAPADPASPANLIALLKREGAAEIKFRDQLAQRLSAGSCIVTNLDVFSDPKNFPQLKGSPSFKINAAPSFTNPNLFAIAITATAVQGPYAEDEFLMFTQPVLIEGDSDYTSGADVVMKMWQLVSEGLSRPQNK